MFIFIYSDVSLSVGTYLLICVNQYNMLKNLNKKPIKTDKHIVTDRLYFLIFNINNKFNDILTRY